MAWLGALAGIAPGVMFVALNSIMGWHGTLGEVLVPLTVVLIAAVVAGWVVGSRIGSSTRSSLLGVIAHAGVAWLTFVPFGVIQGTWQRVQDGGATDPVAVVVAMVGLLAYAFVSSVYVVPLLVPFGAVWMVAFRLLGRVSAR